jgi:hypothetical protein
LIPRAITAGIAIVVTCVWVGAFLLDAFVPTYEVNPMIHTAFAATLAAAYTLNRNKDGDKAKDEKPDELPPGEGGAHRRAES